MNDIEGKVSFPYALLHNRWSESVIDDAISYSSAIFHPHRCLISPRDHSLCIMESQRHTLCLGRRWYSDPPSISSNQKTFLWRQTSSNQVCLSISLWTKNDIYYPVKNKSSGGYNLWWHIKDWVLSGNCYALEVYLVPFGSWRTPKSHVLWVLCWEAK